MDRRTWGVVGGLALASGLVIGLTMTALGIFVGPLQDAFDVSAAEAAAATSGYLLFMTFGAPLCGWLIDRFGVAPVATLGAIAVAAGCALGSTAGSFGWYLASMSLAGLGAGASTYVPSTLVIRSRAAQHAALAFGAYLAGMALICSVTPLLVSQMVAAYGWRAALRMVALAVGVVAVPLLARLAHIAPVAQGSDSGRGGPQTDPGTLSAEFLSRGFLLVALIQVLTGVSFQQVFTYIVPYLTSVGYSPDRASTLFGATTATSIIGFFLFGLLADRIGPRRALVSGTIVCGLATPLLLVAGQAGFAAPLVLGLFVLLWGATCSLSNQFVPLLLGGVVSESRYATMLGISFVIYGVAGAAGPAITGHLVDQNHGYAAAFSLAAVLMFASAAPALALRRNEGA